MTVRLMRTCALVAVSLLLGTVALAQTVQPFRAGTELVAIDITVVDAAGNPVPDLQARDFAVTVAGQPRAIQSLQFIPSTPTGNPTPAGDAEVSTNQRPPSGRTLLIVVDEWNLKPGGAVALVRNAKSLLARLSPGGLAGLARMPEGGGVPFTTNHALVVDGLNRINGTPPRARGAGVTVYLCCGRSACAWWCWRGWCTCRCRPLPRSARC